MPVRFQSSRLRFRQYKRDLKNRKTDANTGVTGSSPNHAADAGRSDHKAPKQKRSFFVLLREFWGLLEGFHGRLIFALATATIATGLGLIPPYATKLVVDNILGHKPIPEQVKRFLPLPADPHAQLA